jgi:hypothetical protein
MAAVTINSAKYTVMGNMRSNFYNITGNTGDTLTVGMYVVRMVDSEGSVVTAYTTAPGANAGQTVITLTGVLGANTDLQVTGN